MLQLEDKGLKKNPGEQLPTHDRVISFFTNPELQLEVQAFVIESA